VKDNDLRGAYQVFEGAVTDDPNTWYEAAKKQYTDRAGSIPAIASIEVGRLEKTTLGGQEAHVFTLDTRLRDGSRYVTLFVFAVRKAGVRVDVHELMITGPVAAFEAHDQEIDKLSSAVEWTR